MAQGRTHRRWTRPRARRLWPGRSATSRALESPPHGRRRLPRPQSAAQARLAFEEAITTIETLRAKVAGGRKSSNASLNPKSPLPRMVDLLTREGRPAEALTFAERAKARVLLDVLETGRVNVAKAMTGQEQEQEHKLTANSSRSTPGFPRNRQPANLIRPA